MTARSVSITFAGSGGAGVMTAGNMLLDAAGRAGWYAYMTRSSGAQIRGGEAAAMMRLSTSPVQSHDDQYDLLVAIDWENVGRFSAEIPMTADSLVVGDPDGGEFPEAIRAKGTRSADIPFKKMAKTIEGGRPNMIALGAVAGLVGLPEDAVLGVVRDSLAKKGEAARTASEASVRAGMAFAADLPPCPRLATAQGQSERLWSITGNEAAGLGAVRGGIRFVAAYPITPGTEVLEWLAPNLAKRGMRAEFSVAPDMTLTVYNMEDPVVGGYTPDKVALRRALSLAYDVRKEIRISRRGTAVPAQALVVPHSLAFDPSLKTENSEYNPAKARALLDLYGYVDKDGDGWRDLPDGSPPCHQSQDRI